MASSEVKYDLYMKDIMKKMTMVINLKGYEVWLLRKKLAMIYLWVAARLLGVKTEREG